MIPEGQRKNEILNPRQSRILNGKKTAANHEENKPNKTRVGKFALIHRSGELKLQMDMPVD
jgi:hypothetical protein